MKAMPGLPRSCTARNEGKLLYSVCKYVLISRVDAQAMAMGRRHRGGMG